MLRKMAIVASGLTIGAAVGMAYWTLPRGGATGVSSSPAVAIAVPVADRTETPRAPSSPVAAERTPAPVQPPANDSAARKKTTASAPAPRQAKARELGPKEQQAMAALIQQLSTAKKMKRVRVVLDLAEYGPAAEAAIPGLLAILDDGTALSRQIGPMSVPFPDGCIGSLAARTLAGIGKPALPGLIAALNSPNPTVVENAASGLSIMKDEEALLPLTAALDRTRSLPSFLAARSSILHALAKVPHPDVILVFLRELTIKTDVDRTEVVQLVGLFKDRRATKTLCQVATSGNREERDAAFSALVELRDPDAVPLLRSICRTANQWTDRSNALRVLSTTNGSAALEEQLILLRSPDKLAREAAACAIRDTANASTLPTLIAMLPDPNPEIRLAVVGAMGNVVDPLSTEALVFATRDADLEVRRLATALLHNRQGEKVEGALLAVLQSGGDTKLLTKALWGLVNQRSQAAIEPLCRLVLSNSDPALRAQALQGLGRYACEDKRVQATLAVVSKDKDPKVRRLAASLQRK